jgi:hypothetical protein
MRAQSSRSRDLGFNPLKVIAALEANMTTGLIVSAMALMPVTPTASTPPLLGPALTGTL